MESFGEEMEQLLTGSGVLFGEGEFCWKCFKVQSAQLCEYSRHHCTGQVLLMNFTMRVSQQQHSSAEESSPRFTHQAGTADDVHRLPEFSALEWLHRTPGISEYFQKPSLLSHWSIFMFAQHLRMIAFSLDFIITPMRRQSTTTHSFWWEKMKFVEIRSPASSHTSRDELCIYIHTSVCSLSCLDIVCPFLRKSSFINESSYLIIHLHNFLQYSNLNWY